MNYKKMIAVSQIDLYKALWFKDILIEGNNAWIVPGNYNALYKINLDDYKVKYLGSFIGENIFEEQLYEKIYKLNDKIIVVPAYANSIGIYDIQNKEFRRCSIPAIHLSNKLEWKFMSSCMYKNKIFMFPGYCSYIVEFNADTEQMSIYDDWYWDYSKKIKFKHHLMFHYDMVVIDDSAYLVSAQTNMIFRFNMLSKKYEFIEVGNGNITTLAYDGNFLWTSNMQGRVFRIDDNNFEKEIKLDNVTSPNFVYSKYIKGNIVLISSQDDFAVYIDVNTFEVKIKFIEKDDTQNKYNGYECHRFHFANKINEDKILVLDRKDKKLKYFDCNGLKEWGNPFIDNSELIDKKFLIEDYYNLNKIVFGKENIFVESNLLSVDALIYYVEKSQIMRGAPYNSNNIGKMIHEIIIK
jgi:hypothetical protein